MKRSRKIIIVCLVTLAVLVIAGIGVTWLMVNDVISMTERSQVFTPMPGTTVEVYRTGRFEYYDCYFSVKRGGDRIIPKTRFDTCRYITVNGYTPEMHTTYDVVVAQERDVVGIIRRDKPYSLLAACDLSNHEVWQGGTWYHEQDRVLAAKLFSILQEAHPDREFALRDSDREAELYRKSIGINERGQQGLGGDSENRAEDGTVPGAPQG